MTEKYFLWAGYYNEISWFPTKADWDSARDSFDFHASFCGDGTWESEVDNCFAGKCPADFVPGEDLFNELRPFITHYAQKINVRQRPHDLDEDGFSPSTGDHWEEDWSYMCDYAFVATPLYALDPQ